MRICEFIRCEPWIHDLREDHKGMVHARLQPFPTSRKEGRRRKFYQRWVFTHPKLFFVQAHYGANIYDAIINNSISGFAIVTVTRINYLGQQRINYASFDRNDELSQRKYDTLDYALRIWFDSPSYHIRIYLSVCELAVCLYCQSLVRS